MFFGIETGIQQEYDDNNYFDALYITRIMGREVTWGSYQVELLGEAIDMIENLRPSNSLNYVTGENKPRLEEIENLKEKDEIKYYPEIIDICIDCLNKNLNLRDLLKEVSDKHLY
jgi:hypothetical protein